MMTEPVGVDVQPGRHEVVVSRDGYTTYTGSVDVLAGGSNEVTALVEVTRCGDGRIDAGEECDDGNQADRDGCSNLCATELYCGDGRVDGLEECDDANRRDDDDCSNTCQRRGPPGFVFIEAGEFRMGSRSSESGRDEAERRHGVVLTRDFYLQSHEVTQGEWRSVMGNNPSGFSSCGNECPVEQVSWWEAVAYANALSRSESLQRCYTLSGCDNTDPGEFMDCESVSFVGLNCEGYRLPTEAEWEYAARAGTTTAWHCGSSEPCVGGIAWYNSNAGRETRTVVTRTSNAWGLYDMSGNVAEWVWDWHGGYPSEWVADPLGPSSGEYRVLRGGGWSNNARNVRSANRYYYGPGNRSYDVGFRLARSAQ